MTERPETLQAESPFFQVTVTKLAILTTVTWGFYFLVWAYLNWNRVPIGGKRRFGLVTRAIILPVIFNFSLFRFIRQKTIEHQARVLPAPSLLALVFMLLSLFSFWKSSWWSLVAFGSAIPLGIVQAHVNVLHAKLGFDPRTNGNFTPLNILACVVGGGYLIYYVAPLVGWICRVAAWKLTA